MKPKPQFLIERSGVVGTDQLYTAGRARRALSLAKRLRPGLQAQRLKILSVRCLDERGKVRTIKAPR